MNIRRGLLAQMASGHVRMVSGEITSTGGAIYITHNFGTKKIFAILQRVNDDHSNIDTTSQFTSVAIFGATVELLDLDESQTYSLNGGTQAHFDSTNTTTNGAYPKGVNSYFPAANGSYPNNGIMAYSDRGISALDSNGNPSDNTIRVYPTYSVVAGRWIYRVYALD